MSGAGTVTHATGAAPKKAGHATRTSYQPGDPRNSARWRGKLTVPRHAHPLVRLLFEEMNRQQTTIAEVTVRAGISPQMMRDWRNRSRPKLDAIDAALNVIGLRLTVEPMPDD